WQVQARQTDTGKLLWYFASRGKDSAQPLLFMPNGSSLLMELLRRGRGFLQLLDSKTGNVKWESAIPGKRTQQKYVGRIIPSPVCLPNGEIQACVDNDEGKPFQICRWNSRTGKLAGAVELEFRVREIAFSADGGIAAMASERTIRIWDLERQQEIGSHPQT